jgi:hypothetical protein
MGEDYDPATGTTTINFTSTASTAVVLAYPQKYIDGTLIQQGDQRVLCDPGVIAVQGDTFTWQSDDYTVVNVKPVSPAGTVVLYELQVRGAPSSGGADYPPLHIVLDGGQL